MTYKDLADFIDKTMRMSHIYQPAMIIELLSRGGRLSDKEIAKALLAQDESQIEYYTGITNDMVGKVLQKRDVVEKESGTNDYILKGFEDFTGQEVNDLKERCKARLLAYIEQRGSSIYDHRRKSAGYISGTIRYEILKRSKFHCDLCGVSAEKKALEVDHIIPRNKGGSDDPSNLQSLCYSCNSMKRDRDDTDFRAVREAYEERDSDCIFCSNQEEWQEMENELAYMMSDGFAVTEGHRLVIPKRHVADYFMLGQAEMNACAELLHKAKAKLELADPTISGFNVGVNVGEEAGQTVMHCHIHLIPRRAGDVDDPVGGIRNVIPGKGNYKGKRSWANEGMDAFLQWGESALLPILARVDYLTVTGISKRIECPVKYAEGLVDHLEGKGYAHRLHAFEDRRKVMIQITRKGIERAGDNDDEGEGEEDGDGDGDGNDGGDCPDPVKGPNLKGPDGLLSAKRE